MPLGPDGSCVNHRASLGSQKPPNQQHMFLTSALFTSAPLQLCQKHYTFPLFHLYRSRHGTCSCDTWRRFVFALVDELLVLIQLSGKQTNKQKRACGVFFFFFWGFSRAFFLDSVLNCFPVLTEGVVSELLLVYQIPACFVARGVFYLHWLLFVLNLIVINIFDLFCVYQTNYIWKLLCMVGALFDNVQIMIPLSWGCFVFPHCEQYFNKLKYSFIVLVLS